MPTESIVAHDHEADALPQAQGFYRPAMGKVLMHTEKRGPAFWTPKQVALTAAGDLIQHLQRGCVSDAVVAYEGLLDCMEVSPLPMPVRIPFLPHDAAWRAVAAVMANCTATDARRHWYDLHCLVYTVAMARVDILTRLIADAPNETDWDAIEDGATDVPAVTGERDLIQRSLARLGVR
jgi:hypothetical protein